MKSGAIARVTTLLLVTALWAPMAGAQQPAPASPQQQQEQRQQPAAPQPRQPRPPQQGRPPAAPQARQGQPQMQQAMNEILQDRIVTRLAQRAYVGANFDVQVQDGTVTLAGTVPSDTDKRRALQIVRRTPGVTEVRDQLRVNPGLLTGSPAIADAELSQRVARQIARVIEGAKAGEDWWLEGWRVEGRDGDWTMVVTTTQGNVTLDGEVPRERLIRKAVETATDVQGVRSVRSNLDVDYVQAGYPYYGYPYYGYPYHAYGPPYTYPYGAYDPYMASFPYGWDPDAVVVTPDSSQPAASPGRNGQRPTQGGMQGGRRQ